MYLGGRSRYTQNIPCVLFNDLHRYKGISYSQINKILILVLESLDETFTSLDETFDTHQDSYRRHLYSWTTNLNDNLGLNLGFTNLLKVCRLGRSEHSSDLRRHYSLPHPTTFDFPYLFSSPFTESLILITKITVLSDLRWRPSLWIIDTLKPV